MGDAATFETLVGMCINEEAESIVDTNAVNELRHLIMASEIDEIQFALTSLKTRIKSEKTRVSLAGLEVLGQLMENCSPSFHTAVASKDWMERLAKLARAGDTVIKNTIMQFLVDWVEEFKFEDFGSIFKETLKTLEGEGNIAPKSKAAEKRKAVVKASTSTPKSSPVPSGGRGPPSTVEKADLPTGVPAQDPVTAGDDYWKAEAEKWRQRWEASANQIMDMEAICTKVKSGSGVADPTTVIELARAVDGARAEHDALKEAAATLRQEMSSMLEEACFTVESAVEAACAGGGGEAAAAAPAEEKPKKVRSPKPAEGAAPEKKKEKKASSSIKAPAAVAEGGEKKTSNRAAKARLTAYFKKVNPDKVSSIDKLLKSYGGKEEELFRKLAEKYGEPVE